MHFFALVVKIFIEYLYQLFSTMGMWIHVSSLFSRDSHFFGASECLFLFMVDIELVKSIKL